MCDEIKMVIGDDGVARMYDDTYDIVIHCESQEERDRVEEKLLRTNWIPVAERLPDSSRYVLVTDYGETDIGRRFDGRWLDYQGNKLKDVTAWMPLPDPYEEGK